MRLCSGLLSKHQLNLNRQLLAAKKVSDYKTKTALEISTSYTKHIGRQELKDQNHKARDIDWHKNERIWLLWFLHCIYTSSV